MPLVVMPFGLSPFGLAVPPASPGQQAAPVIAAELIDPKTRDVQSLLKSADVIDSQVQVALTILRGSGPAVAAVGQRFRDVKKLTENAPTLLEGQARTALDLLVRRGDITISAVTVVVDSPNTFAEVTVEYVNRRSIGTKNRQLTVRVEPSTR